MTVIRARGSVAIEQYPALDNKYQGSMMFNDNPIGGADWYEIELNMITESEIRVVTLNVTDEDNTPLTSGFSVCWYERSKPAVVAAGSSVYLDMTDDKEYEFEIVLSDTLGIEYIEPGRQALERTQDTITFALAKIPTGTMTGRVIDSSGTALVGAEILITLYPNGRFTARQTVLSGADSVFIATVLKTETDIALLRMATFTLYFKTPSQASLRQMSF